MLDKRISGVSVYAAGCFVFVCCLLFPAVLMSYDTPFALIDDLFEWQALNTFSSWNAFATWFDHQFVSMSTMRFRPMFDLYTFATWKLFADHSALHHLMRSVWKAVGVLFVALTVREFARATFQDLKWRDESTIFLTCCLILFFPIAPDARLSPQEALLFPFLAATYYCGLKILVEAGAVSNGILVGFLTGVLGATFSKEPHFTTIVGPTLLVFYTALKTRRKPIAFVSLLSLGSVVFVVFRTLYTIKSQGDKAYTVGKSFNPLARLSGNFDWASRLLFLRDVSSIFLLLFSVIFLSGILISWLLWRRRKLYLPALMFLATILSFGLTFVMTLVSSETQSSRYLAAALYVLIVLIGLSSVLFESYLRSKRIVRVFLSVFAVYFVLANYSNFLFQYEVQWRARHLEQELREFILHRFEKGDQIHLQVDSEYEGNLETYFARFLPYFTGDKRFKVVRGIPIEGSPSNHIFITRHQSAPALGWEVLRTFRPPSPRLPRIYTTLGNMIPQLKPGEYPYLMIDGGVPDIFNYSWTVYRERNKAQ